MTRPEFNPTSYRHMSQLSERRNSSGGKREAAGQPKEPLRQLSSGTGNDRRGSLSVSPAPVDAASPAMDATAVRAMTELRVENAELKQRVANTDHQHDLVSALRHDNMRLREELTRLRGENTRLREAATEAALVELKPPPPPPRPADARATIDDGRDATKENCSPTDGMCIAASVASLTTTEVTRVFAVLSETADEIEQEEQEDEEDEEEEVNTEMANEEEGGDAFVDGTRWLAEAVAAVAAQAEEMIIFSDAASQPPTACSSPRPARPEPPPDEMYSPSAYDEGDGMGDVEARAHEATADEAKAESPEVTCRSSRHNPGSRRVVLSDDDEQDDGDSGAEADDIEADEDEAALSGSSAPSSGATRAGAKAAPPRSLAEPRALLDSEDEESDEGSDLDGFIVDDEEDPDYEDDEEDDDQEDDDDQEEEDDDDDGDEAQDEDAAVESSSSTHSPGKRHKAAGPPLSASRWHTAASGRTAVCIDVDGDDDDGDDDGDGRETAARTPSGPPATVVSRAPSTTTTAAASAMPPSATPPSAMPPSATPPSVTASALATPRSKASKQLHALAPALYAEYNALVFGSQLPSDLPVTWSPRLLRTAGQCAFKTSRLAVGATPSATERSAAIELSSKVLDSEERLRKTLAHEMCHAAQWLLEGVQQPPHGAAFQRWARRFERAVPGMTISTCHSYDVFGGKFRWGCDGCGHEFARHSKSVDVERKCCGLCRGRLRFLGAFERDGTPVKPRAANPYAQYVKQHYPALKKAMPHASQKEVMAALGDRWKVEKRSGAAAGAEDVVAAAFDVCEESEEEGLLGSSLAALRL